MTKHKHTAKAEETLAYMGGVANYPRTHQEPRAAGGICIVETCACGEVRRTNRNQGHRETSGWLKAR